MTDTAAARAAIVVARRLVSRPARARALARLARLTARGPAPRSRTAPIRERRRGAAAAHTVAVVAPAAAHVVTSHRRHVATPRVAAAAATPTRVAIVTAHVIVAHPNLAVVSRRAAYLLTYLYYTVVVRLLKLRFTSQASPYKWRSRFSPQTPASVLLLTLTLPFLPALFRAWPAAVRCSPRLQTPSPIVSTPSHSLEPHNLVHLRRRRWPAARHPPHTTALIMASRKQDAQPNPIDARTLRTIERVAPQAPEEMLTLTNPNPKVPRSRSPGPWRGPGAAAARRSPM